jgi:transcriptional regulator with XRE-family HTH domain
MTKSQKKSAVDAGMRLRHVRLSLGYTRDQMAAALNLAPATIKNAENGFQHVGADKMARIEMLLANPPPVPPSPQKAETGYSMPSHAAETREDPSPWGNPPPAMLDIVATAVVDPAVRAAVDGMVAAGLTPRAAWRAILQAKLLAEGEKP